MIKIISFVFIFGLLTAFSGREKTCNVINDSREMLVSNSRDINFCAFKELQTFQVEHEDCKGINISIDTSHSQYKEKKWSDKLISFSIRNCTDSALLVRSQDGFVPFIQEAQDSLGNWKPIEYWLNSNCGNSYHKMKINSKGEIRFPIRKYHGITTTKLRVKVKINDQIYFSEPYVGRIHNTQMDIWHCENLTKIPRKEWKENYKRKEEYKNTSRKKVKRGRSVPAGFDFLN